MVVCASPTTTRWSIEYDSSAPESFSVAEISPASPLPVPLALAGDAALLRRPFAIPCAARAASPASGRAMAVFTAAFHHEQPPLYALVRLETDAASAGTAKFAVLPPVRGAVCGLNRRTLPPLLTPVLSTYVLLRVTFPSLCVPPLSLSLSLSLSQSFPFSPECSRTSSCAVSDLPRCSLPSPVAARRWSSPRASKVHMPAWGMVDGRLTISSRVGADPTCCGLERARARRQGGCRGRWAACPARRVIRRLR